MISTRLVAAATRAGRLRPALVRLSSSSSTPSSAVPAKAKPIPTDAPQAPNRASTWSTNQRPRPAGQSGPRFEQTVMELQPNPLSAMELVANEPIRLVHGRRAICDGGKSRPPKLDTQTPVLEKKKNTDSWGNFLPVVLFPCRFWTTWSPQDLYQCGAELYLFVARNVGQRCSSLSDRINPALNRAGKP